MKKQSHRLAMLTDKEIEMNKSFRNKHYKSCRNGSKYIYTLTGTGVGTAIDIECPICLDFLKIIIKRL